MISDENKKKYTETDYNNCPYCGSNEIEGGQFQADVNYAYRTVQCYKCSKEWNDLYKLIGIEEIN